MTFHLYHNHYWEVSHDGGETWTPLPRKMRPSVYMRQWKEEHADD